jgi:hypothetical protein
MLAFEMTQRFDRDFEPGAVDIVEREKANEGDKRLTGDRERPIID